MPTKNIMIDHFQNKEDFDTYNVRISYQTILIALLATEKKTLDRKYIEFEEYPKKSSAYA